MIKTINFLDDSIITVDTTMHTFVVEGDEATEFVHGNHDSFRQHSHYLSLIEYLIENGDLKRCTCGVLFDSESEYCDDCEDRGNVNDDFRNYVYEQ